MRQRYEYDDYSGDATLWKISKDKTFTKFLTFAGKPNRSEKKI
jgi:hypothetical protein